MTEEQFQEALRLRDSGMTVARAAAMIGVTYNTLSGMIGRRGLQSGRGAKPRVLTDEQVVSAANRHKDGETWSDIARDFGVGRSTLFHRAESREDKAKKAKGAYSASVFEPHMPREIRRVIKTKDEVNDLARQWLDGKISTTDFVLGIRA